MKNKKQFLIRCFFFILGLFISGVGVAITKKGELGVSPVSSVANILSIRYSRLTLGNWLIIWNCVLILGQVVVLGRQFKIWQLLQIPLSFLFGWFTDIGMYMARSFPVDFYFERGLWVVAGTLVLSFGITMTVRANVIMNSGEAFVKAISDRTGCKFSTVKIIFDVSCVLISVILSLVLYHGKIFGTREGTVFAAIMTGVCVKMWNGFYAKIKNLSNKNCRKENIKLILTDLDRTLLNTDKKISDRNARALKRCQGKGVLVGFSTSRGLVRIRDFMEQVNPDVVICNDGGVIFYKGELVKQEVFNQKETQALLDKAYEICGPDVDITLDTLDKIFYNQKSPESDNYLTGADYSDFKNFSQSAIKVCVKTDDTDTAKKIAEAATSVDCVKFSDIPWHKFSPAAATKEKAVEFLSRTYNIPLDDIIAFGDDFNDMGMLKKCGTGVAMGNAIDEIKEIADEVTLSNDEDGVAVYLEKRFF